MIADDLLIRTLVHGVTTLVRLNRLVERFISVRVVTPGWTYNNIIVDGAMTIDELRRCVVSTWTGYYPAEQVLRYDQQRVLPGERVGDRTPLSELGFTSGTRLYVNTVRASQVNLLDELGRARLHKSNFFALQRYVNLRTHLMNLFYFVNPMRHRQARCAVDQRVVVSCSCSPEDSDGDTPRRTPLPNVWTPHRNRIRETMQVLRRLGLGRDEEAMVRAVQYSNGDELLAVYMLLLEDLLRSWALAPVP